MISLFASMLSGLFGFCGQESKHPTPDVLWSIASKEHLFAFPGVDASAIGEELMILDTAEGQGRHRLVVGGFDRPGCLAPIRLLTNRPDPKGILTCLSLKDGSIIWTREWKAACVAFGESMCAVGDLNSDGYDDIAVALADLSVSGGLVPLIADNGVVFISGRDGTSLSQIGVSGAGVTFVATIADLSVPEKGALVCRTEGGDGKSSRIARFKHRSWKVDWKTDELAGSARGALCIISDMDGDGCEEIAVGCPDALEEGHQRGRVLICSGKTGRTIRSIASASIGTSFGIGLAAVPDLDGDGIGELAIGDPEHRAGGICSGAVFVWGSKEAKVVHAILGKSDGSRFGQRVWRLDGLTKKGKVLLGVLSGNNHVGCTSADACSVFECPSWRPCGECCGDRLWVLGESEAGIASYARRVTVPATAGRSRVLTGLL